MTLLVGTDLTRRFGAVTAVSHVTVHVDPGEVVGLLGANGAGKTTLLRMLLGLLPPTEGRVRFLDAPPSRDTRAAIGYVPQHLGLYADLTVGANRRFHREVFGLATDDEDRRFTGADDALVGDLSLGAQRRLAFDLATGHDPRLLVLDEPTSGVGPLGRALLWEAIGAAAAAGRGVLVTTHHLAEAEQCDRLVVMAAGRVVASGSVADVVGDETTTLVQGADAATVLGALARDGLVGTLAPGGVAVAGTPQQVRHTLAAAAVEAAVTTRPATLEERFATLAAP